MGMVFVSEKIDNVSKFEKLINAIPNSRKTDYWIYSEDFYEVPLYGYKIHISSDVNNYYDIFSKCLPYLIKNSISFKTISSFDNLTRLNKGEFGYSQIGKSITVYPANTKKFKNIIFDLYLLTKYWRSIVIPSDFNFFNSEVIFYRYGELAKLNFDESNKNMIDYRIRFISESCEYHLPWHQIKKYTTIPDHIIPVKNIHSNGKSKIIKVFNTESKDYCLLKIGRFLGNIEINNLDSFDRIAWEAHLIRKLSDKKYLPKYFDCFIINNEIFLLEEFLNGSTIGQYLLNGHHQYNNGWIMNSIIEIIMDMHTTGYKIIDLSLNNFIITENGIKIIDLEYVYNESDDYFYIENYNQGTMGFYFPKLDLSPLFVDIYAMYKMFFFIYNPKEYKSYIKYLNDNSFETFDEKFVNKLEYKISEKLSDFCKFDVWSEMKKNLMMNISIY
ncbi:protein kinase family protein [Aerococcaceae bacterium zg-ZJ1578]|uniref:class III lanthionine synthetase LanKC N-terminal domain-containing protein n=1 Tax=Aerococcaceae bacterium zg-252 TaxID=2796928 RepID=UPI001A1EFC73|nr:protein kinase family protein [Aerococcaceae bacterium zg-1578]